MKRLLLCFLLFFSFISTQLIAQDRTDYTVKILSEHELDYQGEIIDFSSTYWMGYSCFFEWYKGGTEFDQGYFLNLKMFEYDSDGIFEVAAKAQLAHYQELYIHWSVTSCILNNQLVSLYYYKDYDEHKFINTHFLASPYAESKMNNTSFNYETDQGIASAVINDTLYLFFVDHADGKVKYLNGLLEIPEHDWEAPKIEWISSEAIIVSHSLKAHGGLSACSYVDNDNNNLIMLAYAGEESDGSNEINIFSVSPNDCDIFKQIDCADGHIVENPAIEQGSVKGGSKQAYNFQIGYSATGLHADKGPLRCEMNFDTKHVSEWEITLLPDDQYVTAKNAAFMTGFKKESFKREKELFLMFPAAYRPSVWAINWESDKLIYHRTKEEVPPISNATKFYDLIVVAEGAPPYALNGWTLGDQGNNIDPPSEFDFTQSEETSISTTTKYGLSAEMNMGFGPVTAGFKMSFAESSGTTKTETFSVDEPIKPPLADKDSLGQMFYYYVAPTVAREQWRLCDWDGDPLTHTRNLFFFNFKAPQLKRIAYSLKHYNHSPDASNLHSYQGRHVQDIGGMELVKFKEMDLDIAAGGGSGSMDLTFSETHTQSQDISFTVSVGIEAEYDIFSASSELSVDLEYSRSRETKCEKGFHIEWDNPAPADQSDTNNITSYDAYVYIMKTTSSDAYYLMDGFKNFRPFFITYEVNNIQTGAFGHESVDELIKKYQFKAYPNPASSICMLQYQLNTPKETRLQVYSSGGKLMQESSAGNQAGLQEYQLDVSNYPSGLYLINLQLDDELIQYKILKP